MKHDLSLLSAVQAAEAIREGRISSENLVEAHLARIDETEPTVQAWAYLAREDALEQAKALDQIRKRGRATGSLHGVPVGLKDIVDTADMPTQRGSDLFDGRLSARDARMVERLREEGAVIMGKTRTTELAFMHPTITTNPFDASRTPGGSSSGSAAAVAARHVPLAVGTQTGGSVIRPASFCGTYGFKPTRGTISRSGVFRTSVSLDQVGGFANSLEDIALLTNALAGYDQDDPASFARPRPDMLLGARADAPVNPDIAWFNMPYHDRLNSDTHDGLAAVLDALGPQVERIDISDQLSDLVAVHRTIYDYELRQNMKELAKQHWEDLSVEMHEALTRAEAVSQSQYEDALGVKTSAEQFFASHFNDFDAILSPSASGEAIPLSDGNTGDAIYCSVWTLAGLPCLTLPLLVGENDLPIGVQLIGGAEEDDRLLRTASWVQNTLIETQDSGE